MTNTIIIGVGRTSFGEHFHKDPEELIEEAGLKALQAAGIERKDLDAVIISDHFLQVTNKIGLEEGFISELLELNIPMETSRSFSSALNQACNAIEAGRYSIVLVGGVEKMTDRLDKIRDNLMMLADSWSYYSGGTPEALHEIMLREYAKKHEIKGEEFERLMETLAFISHKNHEFGAKNPHAQFYRRRVKVEDIIKRRRGGLLGIYDFAPISDGATAAVIVNEEKAKEIANLGLEVKGRASCTDHISYFTRDEMAGFKATRISMEKALKEAEIRRGEISLIELYDQSTVMEMVALEDLKLTEPGTAWKIIHQSMEEKTYTYRFGNHEIYVNTNGGLKADGNPLGATGGAQLYETYIQLLEKAGERQISIEKENPYALTLEHEGFGTKSYVYIYGRWMI